MPGISLHTHRRPLAVGHRTHRAAFHFLHPANPPWTWQLLRCWGLQLQKGTPPSPQDSSGWYGGQTCLECRNDTVSRGRSFNTAPNTALGWRQDPFLCLHGLGALRSPLGGAGGSERLQRRWELQKAPFMPRAKPLPHSPVCSRMASSSLIHFSPSEFQVASHQSGFCCHQSWSRLLVKRVWVLQSCSRGHSTPPSLQGCGPQ